MLKDFARFLAVLLACGVAAGCSRPADEAGTPVATPTVTLSRSDAAVGSPIDMTYRFVVAPDAPPLREDYLVFVHFLDENRERMWTDDHEPATPTRQWQPGATIEYTRTVFIPKFPYVGTTTVDIGLYSRQSGERLPLAGQDTGMRAYQVASFNMRLQADNLFVIFKDGWHETEVADDGGLEWQWSKKEGTIAFRNPKRDAELFLQVDQAVNALPEPQRVEVRLGPHVVDSFALPPGDRQLRRIALPASQLGNVETVEIAISVDRTFVPADIPALRSSDARELGIRVFRAYVEPK
jgi:hypothetical protein